MVNLKDDGPIGNRNGVVAYLLGNLIRCHCVHGWISHVCASSVAEIYCNRERVKREEIYRIRFGGCGRETPVLGVSQSTENVF